MNTSRQAIRSLGTKDTFVDVASILAVVLIGLVVLVLAHPRFGTDLSTIWSHHGTQSNHVTQVTLAP
jgi:L-asparagine transporter-like permease